MPVLIARGAGVRRRSRRGRDPWLFRDLDVTVEAGDLVAVVGPPGSGRTTVLLALARRFRLTAGQVELTGRASLGHVPEVSTPEPVFTVTEHIRERLSLLGRPRSEAPAVELHGLDPHKQGQELSPYEKQLLGLILAKLAAPAVFALDGLDDGLDSHEQAALSRLIAELAAQGAAVIVTAREISSPQFTTVIRLGPDTTQPSSSPTQPVAVPAPDRGSSNQPVGLPDISRAGDDHDPIQPVGLPGPAPSPAASAGGKPIQPVGLLDVGSGDGHRPIQPVGSARSGSSGDAASEPIQPVGLSGVGVDAGREPIQPVGLSGVGVGAGVDAGREPTQPVGLPDVGGGGGHGPIQPVGLARSGSGGAAVGEPIQPVGLAGVGVDGDADCEPIQPVGLAGVGVDGDADCEPIQPVGLPGVGVDGDADCEPIQPVGLSGADADHGDGDGDVDAQAIQPVGLAGSGSQGVVGRGGEER